MMRVILAALLAAAALSQELTQLERLQFLDKVGISPQQLASLERFEAIRETHEQEEAEYERMLNFIENSEQMRLASAKSSQPLSEENIQIPGEKPRMNDTYLCTAYKQNSERYIVGFEPMNFHNVHHILLFGCEAPGIDHPVPAWDCGEMAAGEAPQYPKGSVCSTNPDIIYAWAKGAPNLQLPEGVAFNVGGRYRNQFLVVQVHYMHAVTDEPDFSGVKIRFSEQPQPKTAATMLIVTGGSIQPYTTDNFEAACVVNEDVEMHPIAFRTHTHSHGKKVSGWVVREDSNGQNEWTLIGERDPQKEQLFEKVKNESMVIRRNDILAARCVIENNEDRIIEIGPTGADEMCNFYMMYWVEGKTVNDNTCYSPGPPTYRFFREAELNNIPQ